MPVDFTIAAHDLASNVFDTVLSKGKLMADSVGTSISKLGSSIGGELGEILGKVGEGFNAVSESASGMAGKLTAAGLAITTVGVALQAMGSKDAEAEASLKAAIEATGGSMDDYKDDIERVVKAEAEYGHGAADTQQALSTLTQKTGDAGKALDVMQLVTDLAAAKNISLNESASLVAKAMDGNNKLFTQYDVSTKNADNSTKSLTDKMNELASKLSGQGAAAVDSFSGRVKQLATNVENFVSGAANKYAGWITAAGTAMTILGTILQTVAVRQTAAATTALAVAAADEAQAGAAADATAATVALDAASAPFLLILAAIVIAIAAVIAIIVLLVTHWDEVTKMWDDSIGRIGEAFKWLWGIIQDGLDFIGKIYDAVEKFFGMINQVINALTSPFSMIASLVGSIPGLAGGGIVTQPTLAMIGESGPEAVIPLDGSGGGLPGGGTTVIVYAGAVGSEQYLARTVVNALKTVRGQGGGYYT